MKKVVFVAAFVPLFVTLFMGVTVAATLSALGGSTPASSATPPGVSRVPMPMLRLYSAAAARCPGLSWSVLAAIGTVESDNGRSTAPGVHSGHNSAGAEGPMQFEPATFAAYDEPVPPGGANPPSPYDAVDAVYAAERMLCADVAGTPSRLVQAIYDYNHSTAYVSTVLADARAYGLVGSSPPGDVAVEYALAQVGTPYRWGGEQPGIGFDCSGLAQASWQAAGTGIPRVAQDQYDAGPAVPPGVALDPGDLVFFGSGPTNVVHVGIVVDPSGVMVDAPHSGADVRVESFPTRVGANWGGETYLGATNPGGA
ncbi:MAG TPA: NlpC/P60 family protein [Acidimicrobiales bacterium]|nr:NlpC/P60 family protein [Acidimicrobiales bacterium]